MHDQWRVIGDVDRAEGFAWVGREGGCYGCVTRGGGGTLEWSGTIGFEGLFYGYMVL